MDTIELLNKIRDAEKQIADARRLLEEYKKSGVVRPKDGNRFYFINQRGDVSDVLWTSDPVDEDKFKIGNVFNTQDDAERAVRRLKTHQKLKEFAYKYNDGEIIDMENWSKNKCLLSYGIRNKCLCYSFTGRLVFPGIVYFKDEHFLDALLEEIPEDELIEYCKGG